MQTRKWFTRLAFAVTFFIVSVIESFRVSSLLYAVTYIALYLGFAYVAAKHDGIGWNKAGSFRRSTSNGVLLGALSGILVGLLLSSSRMQGLSTGLVVYVVQAALVLVALSGYRTERASELRSGMQGRSV